MPWRRAELEAPSRLQAACSGPHPWDVGRGSVVPLTLKNRVSCLNYQDSGAHPANWGPSYAVDGSSVGPSVIFCTGVWPERYERVWAWRECLFLFLHWFFSHD